MQGRLSNLKDIGDAFGALRALRPLLFVDDEPYHTLAARLSEVLFLSLMAIFSSQI